MRVLFLQRNQSLPDIVGGIERNTEALIHYLKSRNIIGAVVCCLDSYNLRGLTIRASRKIIPAAVRYPDYFAGYPTYRYWEPSDELGFAVDNFKPDILVVQTPDRDLLRACLSTKLPVVFYLHGVWREYNFEQYHQTLSNVSLLACGQFVADYFASNSGFRAEVIHPLIEPSKYKIASSQKEVLLINPRIEKGVDTAWKLAEAFPDIPFRFVESWHFDRDMHKQLVTRARQSPNVTIAPSSKDMLPLFARAKILLQPSHTEGHPRAVSEAHVSGIPVLASDRGGLPEAVGPGGVCLPLENGIEPWKIALGKMWRDPQYYSSLSQSAQAFAQRADFQPEAIANKFVTHLTRRISAG